jgi:AAA domain
MYEPFERPVAPLLAQLLGRASAPSALATATIRHPRLSVALAKLQEALASPADHRNVLLVGAAGAGKTKALALLLAWLDEVFAPLMTADVSIRPVVVVSAPAASGGTFSWLRFGGRILEALDTPALAWATAPSLAGAPAATLHRIRGMKPDDILAMAADECLLRKVQVIIVDEAGHLAVVARSPHAREQLDVLKDFSQRTGVRFLLAGTYDLLAFRDASAQLARRTRVVHLRRYREGDARDEQAFARIAREMLALVEGGVPGEVEELLAELFAGSLGCAGNLRDWLVDAEALHRNQGGRASFTACLRDARKDEGQLQAMRDELVLEAVAERPTRPAVVAPPIVAPPTRNAPRTASGQILLPGELKPHRRPLGDPHVGA